MIFCPSSAVLFPCQLLRDTWELSYSPISLQQEGKQLLADAYKADPPDFTPDLLMLTLET